MSHKEHQSRKDTALKYLSDYLSLKDKFENPPEIFLELSSRPPNNNEDISVRDIVITTAVQCYAPGVANLKPRRDDKSTLIAESTLKAGHHTTRLHTSYTWKLSGVSRSIVHDLLHANPFYNSEQQSQRYVEVKNGSYLLPKDLTNEQKIIYLEAADYTNAAYFLLLKKLETIVENRMQEMYPSHGFKVEKTKKRLEAKSKKISQEVARYVLPVGQKTTLDHTLSELQLLRLFRASAMPNISNEGKYIVAKMISEVAKYDPAILDELDIPVNFDSVSTFHDDYVTDNKAEFDNMLGNQKSKLMIDCASSRKLLASALRNVLGMPEALLPEKQALSLLLDPSSNKSLTDIYDIGMLDPVTSVLRQVYLTYATKLSHSADSQRQRHRRTPGATPTLEANFDGNEDYTTPLVIAENTELNTLYKNMMSIIYANINKLLDSGVPKEYALLLIPNAHNIRVFESGDFFDWIHRWKQRLCFLAQEEIFFISVEQVLSLQDIFPEAKNLLLAPCGSRQAAGISPRCPEGDRWCGKPVYNWDLYKYAENRLI